MKKILQICAVDYSVDALLKPLILSLMEKGYTVHNACTDSGKFHKLRDQGLYMIDVPIDRKISPVSNLRSVLILYALMKKEKYDIVHVHTPIAAVLGRVAAKFAGIKHIVYTAHGFYFHEGMSKKKYQIFYNVEKFFAKYLTDWILLQSKEDYELCIENNFKTKERIVHISNGVDIYKNFNPELIGSDVKEQLKKELGIDQDDIVICFIGRLVREKGIFELLESFNTLKKGQRNVKLLIIGETLTSERDQNTKHLLKEMFNNPDIIVVGFRTDISQLLSISDIFVLPSYREGLPRSIIEAMAMKKPIIATNIRGCREEVVHGENGFLVEKQNALQLYEQLELLIDQDELRKQFGENSRKIVEAQFNEEIVIQKQYEVFNRLKSSSKEDEN